MQNVINILQTRHRPRLLMRTAQIGARGYNRNRQLVRLIKHEKLPRHTAALLKLMEIEEDLNTQRETKISTYNVMRHVDVMIAILGEVHLLRRMNITQSTSR